ncbi:hypothetical protein MY11210_007503, partial [Beauveria gryllotalpidicola]
MAIVPPEGLETHQTVAIPRNLAIVATNYTAAGSAVRGALVTGARANSLEEKHGSSDDKARRLLVLAPTLAAISPGKLALIAPSQR